MTEIGGFRPTEVTDRVKKKVLGTGNNGCDVINTNRGEGLGVNLGCVGFENEEGFLITKFP